MNAESPLYPVGGISEAMRQVNSSAVGGNEPKMLPPAQPCTVGTIAELTAERDALRAQLDENHLYRERREALECLGRESARIGHLIAENAALVEKLAAAENDNDRLSQMVHSCNEMMAERDALRERLNTIIPARDAMAVSLDKAIAQRDRAYEEVDRHKAEKAALSNKLGLLIAAIGPYSTTDIAIKAIERDRAERDRYRAELERLQDVVGEVDYKLIEGVLSGK